MFPCTFLHYRNESFKLRLPQRENGKEIIEKNRLCVYRLDIHKESHTAVLMNYMEKRNFSKRGIWTAWTKWCRKNNSYQNDLCNQ